MDETTLIALEAERDYYKELLAATVSALDCWKTPLLNPDGVDDSEAIIRLIADDLRKVLNG